MSVLSGASRYARSAISIKAAFIQQRLPRRRSGILRVLLYEHEQELAGGALLEDRVADQRAHRPLW